MVDSSPITDYPKVSIITLNWNGWKDTLECLESLYQITYPNYEVILVDNGSEDDSIKKLKEYCEGKIAVESSFFEYSRKNKPMRILKNPRKHRKITQKYIEDGTEMRVNQNSPIKIVEYTREEAEAGGGTENEIALPPNRKLILIKNEKNYGFAEGNNVGMRYALKALNPDYILLLNNDTVVDRAFLAELVKVADSDGRIGSVQSLLLRPGGEVIDSLGQELVRLGARDKGFNHRGNKNNFMNAEIFGACAAAALYRCKLLKEIGLFDKDFFIIYEDVDLSWRIRLKGFSSILASKSIVYHKRGISGTAPSDKILFLLKEYHGNKNWLLLVLRYYPLSVVSAVILKTPLRFFYTLFMCVYSALKLRKLRELFGCAFKSLKIRKGVQENPLLSKIQTKWINDK